MSNIRPIRPNEIELLHVLFNRLGMDPAKFPLPDLVDEYEDGKMGSIGLIPDAHEFDGDLIQVEYFDADDILVVITLTKNIEGQPLDLDFWKTDFSALIEYPTPDKLIFLTEK